MTLRAASDELDYAKPIDKRPTTEQLCRLGAKMTIVAHPAPLEEGRRKVAEHMGHVGEIP